MTDFGRNSYRRGGKKPKYREPPIDVHEYLKSQIAASGNDPAYQGHLNATQARGGEQQVIDLQPVNSGAISRGISQKFGATNANLVSVPGMKIVNPTNQHPPPDGTGRAGTTGSIPRPVAFTPNPTSNVGGAGIGVADKYINFDTATKVEGSDPTMGIFVFDVQLANNGFPIENVIEMEVQPFNIPIVNTDTGFQPDYFVNDRVVMTLETEIDSTQRVKSTGGNRAVTYHFEFDTTNTGTNIVLTPILKKYVFTKPIRGISVLRIDFRAPAKRARFSDDVLEVTSVSPPIFGPFGDRLMETVEEHGLTVGSSYNVVFLDGTFISSNTVLTNAMDQVDGHVVEAVSPTRIQFTTTPNANLLGTTPGATGRLLIIDLNIRFTIRFREIKTEITNYISP